MFTVMGWLRSEYYAHIETVLFTYRSAKREIFLLVGVQNVWQNVHCDGRGEIFYRWPNLSGGLLECTGLGDFPSSLFQCNKGVTTTVIGLHIRPFNTGWDFGSMTCRGRGALSFLPSYW